MQKAKYDRVINYFISCIYIFKYLGSVACACSSVRLLNESVSQNRLTACLHIERFGAYCDYKKKSDIL